MTSVLYAEGVSKRYGSTMALRDVSLSLEAGECLGLLGPNGAGKTTLVRVIAGRVRPDGGRIRLLGRILEPGSRSGREALGVVPQEIALYPHLTARENLEVFGALLGVATSEIGERVGWALEFTGLTERGDEPVSAFSGGMKRRLNIACSVLHRPRIVLLDEPTVGVDPQSRERIWAMLGELRAEGASLVLTTHQLEEAEGQCERIVIIDGGNVIADGTLEHLVETTVGPRRQVRITLDRPWQGAAPGPFAPAGLSLEGEVDRLGDELPGLLREIASADHRIVDLHVEQASLHAVFIHLTGRALRE